MPGNLPFLAPTTVAQHALVFARSFGIDTQLGAGPAYRRALDLIQPTSLTRTACDGTSVLFHGHRHQSLFDTFLAGLNAPPAYPFRDHEMAATRAALATALDLLRRLHTDARATFDLLVHALMVVRIPAFGSLSNALGIVVAGPDPEDPPFELAELLFHEAVHQALFLADAVTPLFVNVAPAADAELVDSPLLGMARPFDLAFHGTAVSVALVHLHLLAGSYARAFELAKSSWPSLDALAAASHCLTPHGAALLAEIRITAHALAAELDVLAARGLTDQGKRFKKRSYLELPPGLRQDS